MCITFGPRITSFYLAMGFSDVAVILDEGLSSPFTCGTGDLRGLSVPPGDEHSIVIWEVYMVFLYHSEIEHSVAHLTLKLAYNQKRIRGFWISVDQ